MILQPIGDAFLVEVVSAFDEDFRLFVVFVVLVVLRSLESVKTDHAVFLNEYVVVSSPFAQFFQSSEFPVQFFCSSASSATRNATENDRDDNYQDDCKEEVERP